MKQRLLLPLLALGLLTQLSPLRAQEIDALTFNIRNDNPRDGIDAWPKRQAMVNGWLGRERPTVMGLQEAKKHQLDAIAKALPGYGVFGVGRDDGKTKGEYSPILWDTAVLERDPKEGGTFWFSDTPEKIASTGWGNRIPRICTWSRFVEKKTGRGLYVFNTHFDHQSQPSREKSARLMVERIAARARPSEPVIAMGDFNAAEDNPAMEIFRAAPLSMFDTYRTVHPNETLVRTGHGFRGGKAEGGKIDSVLILPDTFQVKAAEIIRYEEKGRYLSDHYPVRALLKWPAP